MEGSESLASRSDFIATEWEPYTEALPVVEKDIFTASRESVDGGGRVNGLPDRPRRNRGKEIAK